MTIDPANAGEPSLVERAKNILLQPKTEWERIAAETTPISTLVTGYLLPLVAAVVVAAVLGGLLMTGFFFGGGILVPMLVGTVAQIVIGIASILLWGIVINALAPSFGSEKNQDNALRLAIYASTAVLVAGLSLLLPVLAFLVLIAGLIYSAMLLYHGLPGMMHTPEDKRVPYVLTVVGIAIVASILMSMIYSTLMLNVRTGPSYTFGQNVGAEAPAQGAPELTELQRQALQNGAGTTVDHARVQEQLPPSLPGGFALASSSSKTEAEVAQAQGVYRSGDAELRLTVMQTGEIGALTTLAAGMTMHETGPGRDGYARTQAIDGRIYSEEVNNAGGSASYSVVGRGVAVSAEGTNITLDQARAAVETIGVQRLEREFGA